MKRTAGFRVRHFWWAAAVLTSCPFVLAYAQETPGPDPDDSQPIEEIVVSVDRRGRPVDINALRLEEARLVILREFELQQFRQEEENWRLKLRSALLRNTSRIAWGYDAQADAARTSDLQPYYLPIDRVRPATVVSFRF
jgi:hypothetical protein